MAEYKVPQDVEADDKLIGPFNFRQFVYLLIVAALIAIMFGLFQIFPLLAIIPLPPILLLLALALPLKKDQPMETYLTALISYYLKPRTKVWMPGQRETTIKITAPKIVDKIRTRNISGEEATHRLSFLADIVDTEGYIIKDAINKPMREDLVAEANTATDIFETFHFDNLSNVIDKDETNRHQEVVNKLRLAIEKNNSFTSSSSITTTSTTPLPFTLTSSTIAQPPNPTPSSITVSSPSSVPTSSPPQTSPIPPKPSIIELANNPDFSVETIAKEAKRINRKDEGEVFVSLR